MLKRIATKIQSKVDVTSPLYVGGLLGGGVMAEVDQFEGGNIRLVTFADWDFNDAETKDGDPIYEFSEIDDKVYANIDGFWDTETINVQASLFFNVDWARAFRAASSEIGTVARRSGAAIEEITGQ